MRDDFPMQVKENLAKRVAHRCSRPECRQVTCGPQEDPEKAINVGVAAHITAASPGGPRYDHSLTIEQRQSIENSIWLCQTCAKLIDNDPLRYSSNILKDWKKVAETAAIQELENRNINVFRQNKVFDKINKLMPGLLLEMQNDLKGNPLKREFVLLSKRWNYWASGNELMYYFEDHPGLESMMHVLKNHNLIADITFNEVSRYVMSEDLVDFLIDSDHETE